VIENGESGGGTAAPKVNAVLKSIFGEAEELEPRVGERGQESGVGVQSWRKEQFHSRTPTRNSNLARNR